MILDQTRSRVSSENGGTGWKSEYHQVLFGLPRVLVVALVSTGAGGTGWYQKLETELMRADLLTNQIANRAADLRAIILPFVIAHSGIVAVIVFGADGLKADGATLALAAWAVLGSLWAAIWTDGCIQDIGACAKDMDDEMANSQIGRNFAKSPFGLFRLINLTVVVLIVVAELMALY